MSIDNGRIRESSAMYFHKKYHKLCFADSIAGDGQDNYGGHFYAGMFYVKGEDDEDTKDENGNTTNTDDKKDTNDKKKNPFQPSNLQPGEFEEHLIWYPKFDDKYVLASFSAYQGLSQGYQGNLMPMYPEIPVLAKRGELPNLTSIGQIARTKTHLIIARTLGGTVYISSDGKKFRPYDLAHYESKSWYNVPPNLYSSRKGFFYHDYFNNGNYFIAYCELNDDGEVISDELLWTASSSDVSPHIVRTTEENDILVMVTDSTDKWAFIQLNTKGVRTHWSLESIIEKNNPVDNETIKPDKPIKSLDVSMMLCHNNSVYACVTESYSYSENVPWFYMNNELHTYRVTDENVFRSSLAVVKNEFRLYGTSTFNNSCMMPTKEGIVVYAYDAPNKQFGIYTLDDSYMHYIQLKDFSLPTNRYITLPRLFDNLTYIDEDDEDVKYTLTFSMDGTIPEPVTAFDRVLDVVPLWSFGRYNLFEVFEFDGEQLVPTENKQYFILQGTINYSISSDYALGVFDNNLLDINDKSYSFNGANFGVASFNHCYGDMSAEYYKKYVAELPDTYVGW